MKEQKFSFLSRILSAIKLNRYQELAGEKFTNAIKFTAKLMIVFTLIVSIGITIKFNNLLDSGNLTEYLNEMEKYGLQSGTTEQMIQEIESINRPQLLAIFYVIIAIYLYAVYFILSIMDIILLAIFGYLIARVFKIAFKFEAVYNIATYSLVLSILLNAIYMVINSTTDITVKYFGIVYNLISYIYLVAAILIIKSDIIKTNIELMAIVQEQEKVKQEMEGQREEKQKEDENDEKKENELDESEENEIPDGENGEA